MNKQVLKADKEYRKKTIIIVIIAIFIGLAVLAYFHTYINEIKEIAAYNPEAALTKAFNLLRIFVIIMALTLIAFGFYILHISMQVIKFCQFPPPGTKVIKDTKLITGQSAKTKGIIGIVLAVVIIITGFAFPGFFFSKFNKILKTNEITMPNKDIKIK